MIRKITIAILLLMPYTLYAQHKSARAEEVITIYNDIVRQLDVNYVDSLPYAQILETSVNQMLRQIDPYTVYYPKDKERDLKMMTTGKYGGIGSIIQQREEKDEKGKSHTYTIISEPYEGMPAQKNGVWAGDRILEIDGKKMDGKSVSEVSNALRGVPHTIVKLKLQREGIDHPFEVEFEREEIKMSPVAYAGMVNDSIGYISFTEFTEHSSVIFKNALDSLVHQMGARALILDLRDNGGGLVSEAVEIVNLFVDKGTSVVTTRGKVEKNARNYITKNEIVYPHLPLVVLVNHNSASASEIVAGSLQDLHRATIVGERTYGKGLVQSVFPIAHDGYIKLTTAKYYLPSGRCIQAIDYSKHKGSKELKKDTAGGILPDVIIEEDTMRKVDICYSLYAKQMPFDFATRYRSQHSEIMPLESFEVTDEMLEAFCQFLDEKGFTYETETGKYFADVIRMAAHEDIDSATIAELNAFKTRLQPSYREAIDRHKDDVKKLIGSEIVERYYFQKGRIAYMLTSDNEIKRAAQVLIHE